MKLNHSPTLRWLALGLGTVVLLMSALVARTYQAGTSALARSDQAFDAGHLEQATTAARVAATWYLPHAPHVDAAHRRLRAIALGAEAQGDVTVALRAWGALRAALIETNHPWTAREGQISETSQAVARLLLLQNKSELKLSAAGESDREAALHRAYLQPLDSGRGVFSVLTSVGMWLMLACGLRLLSGSPLASVKQGLLVRTGLLVGFGLWILAAFGA